jgi:hypothetical protein
MFAGLRNIRSARADSARHGSYFLLGTRLDVHHTGYIPQQRARRGVLCGASKEDYGSDWSYYDDSFESGQGPRSIVGRHAANHHTKPKAYATYGAMYGFVFVVCVAANFGNHDAAAQKRFNHGNFTFSVSRNGFKDRNERCQGVEFEASKRQSGESIIPGQTPRTRNTRASAVVDRQ